MNPDHGDRNSSRRSFLLSGAGWMSGAWIAAHWPAIASAAHHAENASSVSAPADFGFLNAADAADVDAICAQIVPSGATPGAREAHAAYFIDRALATFFAAWAPEFHSGLQEFQAKFRALNPASGPFATSPPEEQIAYLKTVDESPFFEVMRTLTILGMFSSPKYGGNFGRAGWSMMGFVDQHAFAPPFGYYDREYGGFVPYADGKRS